MENMVKPDEHYAGRASLLSRDTTLLILVALGTVLIHLLTGSRYGFHRDELQTLDDARHMAWGFVTYPPVTPFFARLSLELFETSLTGFRIFAFLAEAAGAARNSWPPPQPFPSAWRAGP